MLTWQIHWFIQVNWKSICCPLHLSTTQQHSTGSIEATECKTDTLLAWAWGNRTEQRNKQNQITRMSWYKFPQCGTTRIALPVQITKNLIPFLVGMRVGVGVEFLKGWPRVSCDLTRARGQLRPYPQEFYGRVNVFCPYPGSAATLPDLSVKNPTFFFTISRFDGFMVSGFWLYV